MDRRARAALAPESRAARAVKDARGVDDVERSVLESHNCCYLCGMVSNPSAECLSRKCQVGPASRFGLFAAGSSPQFLGPAQTSAWGEVRAVVLPRKVGLPDPFSAVRLFQPQGKLSTAGLDPSFKGLPMTYLQLATPPLTIFVFHESSVSCHEEESDRECWQLCIAAPDG